MATFDDVIVTDFLDVRGNTKLGNASVDVTTITGDANVGRNLMVNGTMSVNGDTNLGNAVGDSVSASGSLSVGSTLDVTGAISTAGAVTAGTNVSAADTVTAGTRVVVTDTPVETASLLVSVVIFDSTSGAAQPGLVLTGTSGASYVIFIDDGPLGGPLVTPRIIIQSAT